MAWSGQLGQMGDMHKRTGRPPTPMAKGRLEKNTGQTKCSVACIARSTKNDTSNTTYSQLVLTSHMSRGLISINVMRLKSSHLEP
jgi:hypothetical protein